MSDPQRTYPMRSAIGPSRALLNRLHQAVGKGLIALEGPPGVGKTQLAAAFAAEYDCDAHYVPLDASCTSPEVLAERLLLSLRPADLKGDQLLSIGDLRAAVLRSIRSAKYGRPLLLVIDNLEHLAGAGDAMKLIEAVLKVLPGYADALLIGRSIPSHRIESDAKAAGSLWLTARDLGMRGDCSRSATASTLRTVGARGAAANPIVEPTARKCAIPPDTAGGLAVLSMLPQVTPNAIREILDRNVAEQVSTVLRSSPGILEPQFRTGVLHVRRSGPTDSAPLRIDDTVKATCDRACRYLLRMQLPHHAAALAVNCGSQSAALSTLAAIGPQAFRDGALTTIAELASLIDMNSTGASPTTDLARAMSVRIEAVTGTPTAALAMAAELDGSIKPDDARIHLLIAESFAARVSGDKRLARDVAAELELVEAEPPTPERADAAMSAGDYNLYVGGYMDRARRLYEKGLSIAHKLNDRALTAIGEGKLGELAYSMGENRMAIEHLRAAVAWWQESDRAERLAVTRNNLGLALAAEGMVQEAADTLSRAVEDARAAGVEAQEAYALASLGELELGFGTPARAKTRLETALAMCSGAIVEERLRALILADIAECESRMGSLRAARRYAVRSILIAESAASPIDHAVCTKTLALIQANHQRWNEAEASLKEAVAVFEAAGATHYLAAADLQLASIAFARGERRKAKKSVRMAKRLSEVGAPVGPLMAVLRVNRRFASWVRGEALLEGIVTETQWSVIESPEIAVDNKSEALREREFTYSAARGTVEADGKTSTWATQQSRTIFEAFLANRDGIGESHLRHLLEPDDPDHRGNTSLQSAMCQLESVLDPGALVRQGETLSLSPLLRVKVA